MLYEVITGLVSGVIVVLSGITRHNHFAVPELTGEGLPGTLESHVVAEGFQHFRRHVHGIDQTHRD